MAMQTDVKAGYVSTSATVFDGRTRFKGLAVTPGSASGTAVVRDGGASGTILFSTATLTNGTPFYVIVPGEGAVCQTDLYVAVTGTGTTATVFYG
jgi:hypothetical protein